MMTVPFDPVPVLTSTHLKFPLLAVYRKNGELNERTIGHRHDVSDFEACYILPSLDASLIELLAPLLMAIRDVLDDRTWLGFDPNYTPTNGTAGQPFWTDIAGVEKVRFARYESGIVSNFDDTLVFYALRMSGVVQERAEAVESGFGLYTGTDLEIDVVDPAQRTIIANVVNVAVNVGPTLSTVTANTGSKAGGTTVLLAGTGFVVGTTPAVIFGKASATGIVVLSTTSVQCVTPAHDAFPTFAADVVLTNPDGQSAALSAAFTYTTP
jgi:hypothetical protein